MPNLLISGPAGAGKSSLARQLLAEADGPTVAADFQSFVAALLLQERDADGRYPIRPEWVLPLAEYLRRATIGAAMQRDIGLIVTNSDGDPDRRQFLGSLLGEGVRERVVDPGEDVVRQRLADPMDGALSRECADAINRWYRR